MKSPGLLSACLALASFFLSSSLPGAVTLPPVLNSNMVLQRGMPAPIWGKADPGEQITVTFRNQKKSVTADAQGNWLVKLDALDVGEPAELVVAGANKITLKNVLVGEVWVGSGQSNIDTPVGEYEAKDPALKEAANKSYPTLRVFRSAREKGEWQSWDPKRTKIFSAQLFYFGLKIQQELNVPVGLIQAAHAGSPSGPFISSEAFKSDPEIKKAAEASNAKEPIEGRLKKYEEAHAKWEKDYPAAKAANVPENKLPKEPQKSVPYGEQSTGDRYEKYVRPLIPFAIRGVLWDQGEGGSTGGIDQPTLMGALIRSWRKDWGQGDFPWIYVKKPSGGGCALDPSNPVNAGAEPFTPTPAKPDGYHTKLHHEGYSVIRKNPHTYLVNTSDLATGVHPANKSGYGTRGSLVALGAVYGKPVEYYGPVYASHKVEGDKLRISYTHVGKGLRIPEGQKLQGFQIAGEDKKFQWADAVIEGETVVLSSPNVPTPVAARYAWTWPLASANLFNAEGLPAFTFRTDTW